MKDKLIYQRRVLAVLCALLAPSSIGFGLLGHNLDYWYCSISATYYANSKICMIGLLFATAVYFLTYRGYDKLDIVLSILQGISAIGIIVFPCATYGVEGKVGLLSLPVSLSHIFHCASASILFICFGIMITFAFTKGDKENPKKRMRNKIYRICGITIFAFTIIQFISVFLPIPQWFPMTLINEFIMLEAFAFAWAVKSGMFKKLNDEV